MLGMIEVTADRIKARHRKNNAAEREEGDEAAPAPANPDAAREKERDAALAKKMADIEPKETGKKPNNWLHRLGYGAGAPPPRQR